jgi:hypothetical protein
MGTAVAAARASIRTAQHGIPGASYRVVPTLERPRGSGVKNLQADLRKFYRALRILDSYMKTNVVSITRPRPGRTNIGTERTISSVRAGQRGTSGAWVLLSGAAELPDTVSDKITLAFVGPAGEPDHVPEPISVARVAEH